MSKYNRQPIAFSLCHHPQFGQGRFKAAKKSAIVSGVGSTKRCFLGQSSGPASWPDYNRYMEPVINKLCQICPSPVSEERWKHRNTTLWWTLIKNAYKKIPTPRPQELACRLEFNIHSPTNKSNRVVLKQKRK